MKATTKIIFTPMLVGVFDKIRGDEWRLFVDCKWDEEDWQDWHWKEQAANEEDQRRSCAQGCGLRQMVPKRVVLVARDKVKPLPKKVTKRVFKKCR